MEIHFKHVAPHGTDSHLSMAPAQGCVKAANEEKHGRAQDTPGAEEGLLSLSPNPLRSRRETRGAWALTRLSSQTTPCKAQTGLWRAPQPVPARPRAPAYGSPLSPHPCTQPSMALVADTGCILKQVSCPGQHLCDRLSPFKNASPNPCLPV